MKTGTKRIVRGVFGVMACVLVAVGALCVCEGHKEQVLFEKASRESISGMNADVTRPGAYSGAIEHFLPTAHEIFFYAGASPAFHKEDEKAAAAAVEGLAGSLTVTDAAGKKVLDTAIYGDEPWFTPIGDEEYGILLAKAPGSLRPGRYGVAVNVTSGARGGNGRTLTLRARYFLCGLERLPAFLLYAIATVSFAAALGTGLACLGLTRNINRATRAGDAG